MKKIGEWLAVVAMLLLPGVVTLLVLYLMNRGHDDDDWNLF